MPETDIRSATNFRLNIIIWRVGHGIVALSAILLLAVMVSITPIATADHSPGHKGTGGPPSNPGTIIDCEGGIASPIDGTTPIIDASIRVPDGETCYINSNAGPLVINGNVIAGTGSELHIQIQDYVGDSLQINGDVKSDGADKVRIMGSHYLPVDINGDVQIKNTVMGIIVSYADIEGSAQFNDNLQFYSIVNSNIGESVQVKDNSADLGNMHDSVFAENTVGKNLQCSGNDPVPTLGAFGLNVVTGKAQGQCSTLI